MGGKDVRALALAEPSVKYHSSSAGVLTSLQPPLEEGQCQLDSLTGAVASQRVTEARKGSLRLVGDQPSTNVRV